MKRKKAIILLFLFFATSITARAQEVLNANTERLNAKSINVGVKAGFNSTMFIITHMNIGGITIDDRTNNYKIGYFGSLFLRYNTHRSFIQAEASINQSKCEVTFNKSQLNTTNNIGEASINSTINSIDFPLLYGYNIVKESPYGMSIFIGPKLCYIWKSNTDFYDLDQSDIQEKFYPITVSAVIGLSVNISRLFFDFRYEQGLHNISRSIQYTAKDENGLTQSNDFSFRRRAQVLSFSVGMMF